MGKKTRKTRWRTLAIGDEQSDSEESNSTLDTRVPPTYHQKYYNRFTYSSQSTPTRRYQSDSTKSTRSSSTTSENKITFNEDEYTRITTPRQDVLFKKGYLNKPKTYSTQTSTGNSTTSTGNSTGNGTPDYQSTDLDYESHFVYPNGFLDQNGIYYVNSYDPYPLMVYNAPTYYNNDGCSRTKKYCTESLAETTSTSNNEETPQEASNQNGVGHEEDVPEGTTPPPQINGHHHHHHPQQHHMPPPPGAEFGQVYNVVYPGFYYNGLCPPQELVNCQNHHEEPKRIKRRRRRKLSDSKTDGQTQNGTTSEYTEDEFSSVEEEEETQVEIQTTEDHSTSVSPPTENQTNENSEEEAGSSESKDVQCDTSAISVETGVDCDDDTSQQVSAETGSDCNERDAANENTNQEEKKVKYDLKPDAQEFVPRAFRQENLHYYKIQPGYVPVPMMGPMGPQNFGHPAYLPPGMPLGYIQQNPAIYPGYIPGYIPAFNPEHIQTPMRAPMEEIPQIEIEQETQQQPQIEQRNKNDVDIRTVVSKLEEVANEPQQPERKNHRNGAQFKKPGQHRNYEERKKFSNKNNNTQNGFYQKRQNGRYHNEVNTSITVHQDEVIHENKECSKILEEPIAEMIQEEPDILLETQKETKNDNPRDGKELTQPQSIPNNQTESMQVNVEQKTNAVLQNETAKDKIVNETKETPTFSPKLQQRPTIASIVEGPKTPNKDNNYSDPRKRWPRRDDRNFQKRDQPTQAFEERPNQGFKQNDSPTHRFNKKFNPYSPSRKPTANQTTYYSNENSRKYSETIKKAPQPAMPKPVLKENTVKTVREIKPVIPEATNTPTNKTQWIPVSNKKKRRNKNLEDSDNSSEAPVIEEEETKIPEPEQSRIEDYEQNAFLQKIIDGSKAEESELVQVKEEIPEIIKNSPVKILEVRDLEKELLSNVGVEIKEESESLIAEVKIVEQQTKQKSSSKKKSKKGAQKHPVKRVFITDLDLSGTVTETKKEEPSKDDTKLVEDIAEKTISDGAELVEVEKDAPVDQVLPEPEAAKEEVAPVEAATEKKGKKKKKKSKNTEASSSTQISSEDTYDLLLENTLSNHSEDKTNMEISQELDLIIQRGMYSNLEEKIKALNIIPIKQEFFQSVVRSSRESSTEKNPEFTKLLANSMPKFKYCMASVEDDISRVPLVDLDQASTSRSDLFVENPEVNELLQDIYGKEGTPEAEIGELVTRSTPPREIRIEPAREESVEKTEVEPEEKNETDTEKLYPITQAVKNWMSKTRENTPEVEILKSPSKIFKEFCEIEDTNKNGLVNGQRSSVISESDEEITVYSASRNNSDTADLLDCWENEMSSDSGRQTSIEDQESKRNSDTNEDDEVLEVYESKYGQNEDFLELQREIEEKKKQEQDARSRNFPKHGALPYRAICCNVM